MAFNRCGRDRVMTAIPSSAYSTGAVVMSGPPFARYASRLAQLTDRWSGVIARPTEVLLELGRSADLGPTLDITVEQLADLASLFRVSVVTASDGASRSSSAYQRCDIPASTGIEDAVM